MSHTPPAAILELEQQEHDVVLEAFDPAVAWRLGGYAMQRALADGAQLSIDIRRSNVILFRGTTTGSTPNQQSWIERKAALTLRMEASSALVAARLARHTFDPREMGLDPREYALAGGSFPIRVRSVGVVAAITASGLSSDEDHALVVEALRRVQSDQQG